MIFYLRFSVIIAWAVFSSFLWIPVMLIHWRSPELFSKFMTFISRPALWSVGIKVEFGGVEHLKRDRSYVFVANHQSGLDVLTFSQMSFPKTITVGKRELVSIPLFGWIYLGMGNIAIDREKKEKAIHKLSTAVNAIREKGASIWLFPEGTRNRTGKGLLPFKKGAFYLAIEAEVPVVPLVSASVNPLFNWKGRWLKSGTLKIRILEPIETKGMGRSDMDSLLRLTRDKMVKAYEELSPDAC